VEGTREGLEEARTRGQRLSRWQWALEEIRHAHDLLTHSDNAVCSIARLPSVGRSTTYKSPELKAGGRSTVEHRGRIGTPDR
jgi:hypothetical protein